MGPKRTTGGSDGDFSFENAYLLIALWYDYLKEEQDHATNGDDHEFETIVSFQTTFDLVRRLGGDPERHMFGVDPAVPDH